MRAGVGFGVCHTAMRLELEDRTVRRLVLTFGLGFLCFNVGCGTVAKRAFTEFKGAGSKAMVVPGTSTAALARYNGVRISPIRTDLAGLVSPGYTRHLPAALRERLTQREGDKPAVFTGGSPVLTIEPEITFYARPGALGGIFGSDSYAVVLFWLSADGAAVGKVQVVTKSGASRTKPEDLANSTANGLAGFLAKTKKR